MIDLSGTLNGFFQKGTEREGEGKRREGARGADNLILVFVVFDFNYFIMLFWFWYHTASIISG